MQDAPTMLWKLRRAHEEVACLARLAPYGIEVDIARDGTVILTRVFENDSEALEWAGVKRSARESQGWTSVPPEESGRTLRVS
ncbi:MAG: hypothetical protein LBQ09_03365 [Acidobacteriaceae bacterium]|jgi:hypothetical protein|nr:hypothetical protein [Acidobacteriaceae bacterium]